MNERQVMQQAMSPVRPLNEAITTELPTVKQQRPFNSENFMVATGPQGPQSVCLLCGWITDQPGTNLGWLNSRADQHWTEKHA